MVHRKNKLHAMDGEHLFCAKHVLIHRLFASILFGKILKETSIGQLLSQHRK